MQDVMQADAKAPNTGAQAKLVQQKKPLSKEPDYSLSKRDRIFLIIFAIVTALILMFSYPLLSLSDGTDETVILMRIISTAIFIILMAGMWKGYTNLKTIAVEKGLVSHILANVKGRSTSISEGTIAPPTFDELSRIIPFPSLRQEPVCRRMMERILRDAADYIYEQREGVVRPYKEELGARLFVIGSLQTTALRLGILGTFIGLIFALISMGEMPGAFQSGIGGREVLMNFSKSLFSALQVSFGTSVAGLEVAILLNFLGMYISSAQKYLFKEMDESAGEMMSLARRATYKEKGLLSSFSQMKSSMENLELKIHQENQTTIRSVETLGEKLVEQTGLIAKGLTLASTAQDNWQTFLGDLKEQQSKVFSEALDHQVSIEKKHMGFLTDLEKREQAFIKDLSKTIDLYSFEKFRAGILESISASGQKLEHSVNETIRQFSIDMVSAGNELKQSVASDITELKEQIATVGVFHGKLSDQYSLMIDALKTLSAQLENSKLNPEIFDTFQNTLQATMKDTQEAQLSFQSDIKDAVERLHSVPLDQRLTEKLTETSDKLLSPVNQSVTRIITQMELLNETGSVVKRGVEYIDRIFSNPLLKFGHKLALVISMITGIGFIATVVFILTLIIRAA